MFVAREVVGREVVYACRRGVGLTPGLGGREEEGTLAFTGLLLECGCGGLVLAPILREIASNHTCGCLDDYTDKWLAGWLVDPIHSAPNARTYPSCAA